MFDGGIFFMLLGLSFIFMFAGLKYKPEFKVLSAFGFFVIAIILFSAQDVGFVTTIHDGSTEINQTSYVIGDGNDSNNSNNTQSRLLAWFFMGLGLLMILWFFLNIFKII